MSKVPEDICLIILRRLSSENWTFEVLLKCFKQELEAREKCIAVSKSSAKQREDSRTRIGDEAGRSTRALYVNNEKVKQKVG